MLVLTAEMRWCTPAPWPSAKSHWRLQDFVENHRLANSRRVTQGVSDLSVRESLRLDHSDWCSQWRRGKSVQVRRWGGRTKSLQVSRMENVRNVRLGLFASNFRITSTGNLRLSWTVS